MASSKRWPSLVNATLLTPSLHSRPTWGAISREGLAQWSVTLDTCGFFTRSVEDLELLSDFFNIRDDGAPPSKPFTLKGATFGFCKSAYWPSAGAGTRKAMQTAKSILEKHGAIVEDVELPNDFDKVLGWHAAVSAREGQASFLGQLMTDRTHLHDNIIGYGENRGNVSRKDQLEAYDECARLRPVLDAIASKYDAIVTPSVVDEAPTDVGNTGDMVRLLQVPN